MATTREPLVRRTVRYGWYPLVLATSLGTAYVLITSGVAPGSVVAGVSLSLIPLCLAMELAVPETPRWRLQGGEVLTDFRCRVRHLQVRHFVEHVAGYRQRPLLVGFRQHNDELFAADLTDSIKVAEAVKGSQVVYLVVGLLYSYKVWREKWPAIMANHFVGPFLHSPLEHFLDTITLFF